MPEKILEESILESKKKTMINADALENKYNAKNVTVKVDVPKHVKHLVSCEEVLIGTRENHTKAFRIKNNSPWPAVIQVIGNID